MKELIIKYLNIHRRKNKLYALLYAIFIQRLHWYQITVYYKCKNDNTARVDYTVQIGLLNKYEILQARKVKKLAGDSVKDFPKHLLKNGWIYYKVECYLGRFSK